VGWKTTPHIDHEVKISINFAPASEVPGVNADTLTATLFADYIYLDSDERRRYAQTSHEYLIEQIQFTGDESVSIGTTKKSQNIRLNFNHPCKYLAFVVAGSSHGHFNGKAAGETAEAYAPIHSAKLQLNGLDRFSERKGSYFSQVQPFQHWGTKPASGVYAYSFALKPADHQPKTIGHKSILEKSWMLGAHAAPRHGQIAGKSFQVQLPPRARNLPAGPRVMTVSNGNNAEQWTIRSQTPTARATGKAQRLDGHGFTLKIKSRPAKKFGGSFRLAPATSLALTTAPSS
jgi:hypothetical protein